MFENLKPVAIDPILGLMVAFKADTRSKKLILAWEFIKMITEEPQ